MKILIVDDNQDSRMLLKKILESDGYRVEEASNGKEALDLAAVSPPDMIISDILMPVMDGFKLCQIIREDDKLKHLPFVFYTATYTDAKDEELAIKMGADRFIRKPAEPEEFIKIIREVIKGAGEGNIITGEHPLYDEMEILKLYDDRLIKKLEKNMLDLERETVQRKETEKRLRLIASIVEQTDAGLAVTDIDGRLIYLNRAFAEMHGYKIEELEGKPVSILHTPEQISSLHEANSQIREKGSFKGEFLRVRKDGSVFPALVNHSLYKDEKGNPTGMIRTLKEITEIKEAEKELQESEQKFRNIFNSITDVFYRADIDGRIEIVSPSVQNVSGYMPEEVVGEKLEKFYINPDQREEFLMLLREKGEVNGFESTMRKKDGSVIWASTNAQYYRDSEGNIKGVQGISRDITETKNEVEKIKKLESRLKQAQKMEAIGTLAGGIAHDFNNILSAIIGYTELALMKSTPETEIESDLEEVISSAARAKDLVKQILTFSHQTKEEQKPVQVGLIAKEVLKMLRASLPATIQIHDNIQSKSLILSDPTQFHQLFMNICANAAYAMREKGGNLEVTLTDVELDHDFVSTYPEIQPGTYQKLTISDTGHGMTPEVMSQIFDPFFTTKPKDEGTGLGLSVVHGIVKKSEGMLTVYSEPGQGTTFNIYFPIIKGRADERPEKYSIIPTGTEYILFVDDEKPITEIAERMLASLGYAVEVRTSSLEALELFKGMPDKFDLVITDMTMPNMTGEMLARDLMKIRPNIPIVLCTGFSEMITKEKAETMGIKAFLMKPLLRDEIARTIRKVLNTSVKGEVKAN